MNVDIEALKQGAESLIKKKPSVTGRCRSWKIVCNERSATTSCKSRKRSRKTAG